MRQDAWWLTQNAPSELMSEQAPAPRFRVTDWTPDEFPNLTNFAVEELAADGSWRLVMIDSLPVFRGSKAEAQAIADRLTRGEDVSDCQRRERPAWWDRDVNG